jgi:hypothetical protein
MAKRKQGWRASRSRSDPQSSRESGRAEGSVSWGHGPRLGEGMEKKVSRHRYDIYEKELPRPSSSGSVGRHCLHHQPPPGRRAICSRRNIGGDARLPVSGSRLRGRLRMGFGEGRVCAPGRWAPIRWHSRKRPRLGTPAVLDSPPLPGGAVANGGGTGMGGEGSRGGLGWVGLGEGGEE